MEQLTVDQVISTLFKVRDELNAKDRAEYAKDLTDDKYLEILFNNSARHELIQEFIQAIYKEIKNG